MNSDIKKLALTGLLSGALALSASACSKSEDDKAKAGDETPATQTKPADPGAKAAKPDTPKTPETKAEAPKEKYSETHMCSGLNACKGLGGCKVTDEQLAKLAAAAGVPAEKAGSAHECKGLNECKGLGGCTVDEAKLKELKEKLAKQE